MAVQTFSTAVAEWVQEVEGAAEAVFKQSAQELMAAAQDNCPVDTGFLRGSLKVGINQEPAPVDSIRDGDSYVAEIVPAKMGDTLVARYTARYAGYVEFGTSKMAARGFVRQAAQRWPAIVAANVARLGARLGR